MKKTDYYQQENVVRRYYQWRYGGKSGTYVNRRELEAVQALLPEFGLVLDVPCGVGRARGVVNTDRRTAIGADYSWSMLRCRGSSGSAVRADAACLPFRDNCFDGVVSLRFAIHYRRLEAFMREFARVLRPGGLCVLEYYRWTPLVLNVGSLGGKTYVHTDRQMESSLRKSGLWLQDSKCCFLFSPTAYRFLPYAIVAVLDRLERNMSNRRRVAVYARAIKKE